MDLSRRDFLGTLLAAAVASRVAPAAVKIENTNYHYTSSRWTGFKLSQHGTRIAGQLIGLRNDGQHFYATIALSPEEDDLLKESNHEEIEMYAKHAFDGYSPVGPVGNLISSKIESAQYLMDGFLDSKCMCSSKIIGYSDTEFWEDEDGAKHPVALRPHCGLHSV